VVVGVAVAGGATTLEGWLKSTKGIPTTKNNNIIANPKNLEGIAKELGHLSQEPDRIGCVGIDWVAGAGWLAGEESAEC
jgi:hypothetical protein